MHIFQLHFVDTKEMISFTQPNLYCNILRCAAMETVGGDLLLELLSQILDSIKHRKDLALLSATILWYTTGCVFSTDHTTRSYI